MYVCECCVLLSVHGVSMCVVGVCVCFVKLWGICMCVICELCEYWCMSVCVVGLSLCVLC